MENKLRAMVELDVDVIVLDVDDTLYLERDYVRSGFEAVGAWARSELGIDDFGEQAWNRFEAGSRGRIFDEALAACGQQPDEAVISELVNRYRTHAPKITLAYDAQLAFERWHRVVSLAVVTDGPHLSQEAKVRALALSQWVPLVVYTAALGDGMSKPHPAAFEHVQDALGAKGGRCVYVADNPAKDFASPRRLGWHTVRVRRRGGLHAHVPSGPDVDYEVASLNALDCARPRQ